ncbi:MAG TPA: hypothetical protein DC047_15670 [Blastocatellia bacterium]|nr:hypothetical protein [Blastocatellia bacterium]
MKNKTNKQEEGWDFFLAHAGDDFASAETLYELLLPNKVFLDSRNLLLGDDWDRELPKAQALSKITVVLVSTKTDQAYYEREEIASAIQMARRDNTKHRVVPVFLDEKPDETKVPYGLLRKHSLYVAKESGLDGVASRLKELIDKLRTKVVLASDQMESSEERTLAFDQLLLDSISRLNEDELMSEVIVPLVAVLHPGKIDYVSSSNDANAILISYGIDRIKKSHILGVQVKPLSTSVNGTELSEAASSIRSIRTSGLALRSGRTFVNEAWLVTPYQFEDTDKKRLANNLRDLDRENVRLVSGDELIDLLRENLPDVASRLSKYSSPEIIGLVSALARHTEGRAFGFSTDRNINSFYVTAALSPHATRAYSAIRDEIRVQDYKVDDEIPLRQLLKVTDLFNERQEIESAMKKRAVQWLTRGVLDGFDVPVDVKLAETFSDVIARFVEYSFLQSHDFLDHARFILKLRQASDPISAYLRTQLSPSLLKLIDEFDGTSALEGALPRNSISELNRILKTTAIFENANVSSVRIPKTLRSLAMKVTTVEQLVVVNRALLESAYPKELVKAASAGHDEVTVDFLFHFKVWFSKLIQVTKEAIRNCPKTLTDDTMPVRSAWKQLQKTENFLNLLAEHFKLMLFEKPFSEENGKRPVRIRVPQPEHLLQLDKVLLIEGPPGCGKTTLSKVLAIDMLSRNKKVLYLPCFNISAEFNGKPLERIVEAFAQGSSPKAGDYSEAILIIDGLDEAPYDLSRTILSGFKKFSHLLVSTRKAFDTGLRSEFFRIELAPFTNDERDLFFERWFDGDIDLMNQAKELTSKYPDIDNHTRIPLIATLMVGLLQNGVVPTKRAEIYGMRLDLLLSRWDRMRGVKRLYVDNPEAKRRFIRSLAYYLHASDDRRRNIALPELHDVYEESLGQWGYRTSFEQLLQDLVVGSGVLIEERRGIYSFGHLTFQEHLAGEYIAQNYSIAQIALLMDDDWWREPLNFYASIKGDITELLDLMMEDVSHMAYARQLVSMASHAPYTSAGAVQSLTDYLRTQPTGDD